MTRRAYITGTRDATSKLDASAIIWNMKDRKKNFVCNIKKQVATKFVRETKAYQIVRIESSRSAENKKERIGKGPATPEKQKVAKETQKNKRERGPLQHSSDRFRTRERFALRGTKSKAGSPPSGDSFKIENSVDEICARDQSIPNSEDRE